MFSKWRSRLKRTLGLRLGLWYALVFTASTAITILVTYVLLAMSLEQRDHEIVAATLQEYASEYAAGGLSALATAIEHGQRAGQRERLFVRVLAARRETVFVRMPSEWGPFDLERLRATEAEANGSWNVVPSDERSSALEVASLKLPDGTWVQVGKSTENRDELLRRFSSLLGVLTVCVLVLGLAGGVVLTRSTLRPARRLAEAVRSIIATGRTEVRVQTDMSGDPLDDLGVLFNTMLDRITRLMDGMRDSLDNVAHDLRTPLARLRARAEEAAAIQDADVRGEALTDCIADADRLGVTLDTLMDIAEARAGTLALRVETVPLRKLIGEVIDLYADVAEAKGVSLNADISRNIVVPGDESRLRQVLANLVDNAIKYTPAGGAVTVAVTADPLEASISVRDTGTGVDPRDLPHIWDRLYRGDQSRSSKGLGLGLSLVRAFVEVHGGRVEVASEPARGTVFRVHLPLEGALLTNPSQL